MGAKPLHDEDDDDDRFYYSAIWGGWFEKPRDQLGPRLPGEHTRRVFTRPEGKSSVLTEILSFDAIWKLHREWLGWEKAKKRITDEDVEVELKQLIERASFYHEEWKQQASINRKLFKAHAIKGSKYYVPKSELNNLYYLATHFAVLGKLTEEEKKSLDNFCEEEQAQKIPLHSKLTNAAPAWSYALEKEYKADGGMVEKITPEMERVATPTNSGLEILDALVNEVMPSSLSPSHIQRLQAAIEVEQSRPSTDWDSKQHFVASVNRLLDSFNLRLETQDGNLYRLRLTPGRNRVGYIQLLGSTTGEKRTTPFFGTNVKVVDVTDDHVPVKKPSLPPLEM